MFRCASEPQWIRLSVFRTSVCFRCQSDWQRIVSLSVRPTPNGCQLPLWVRAITAPIGFQLPTDWRWFGDRVVFYDIIDNYAQLVGSSGPIFEISRVDNLSILGWIKSPRLEGRLLNSLRNCVHAHGIALLCVRNSDGWSNYTNAWIPCVKFWRTTGYENLHTPRIT